MQIRLTPAARTATMDVGELAAFARTKEKSDRSAGFHKSIGTSPADSAVRVSAMWDVDDYRVEIVGSADSVSVDGATLCCEFRRTVKRAPAFCAPGDDAAFLARSLAVSCMLARQHACENVIVRIGFSRGREYAAWEAIWAHAVLERSLAALMERAEPFVRAELARLGEGRTALAALRFPYAHIRAGQKELIEETFRCIRRGGRLLAGAPTGIGKTMSAIYPALLALGRGHADRIFYFTAKTVTGDAAMEAVRRLSPQAPALRCIRLSAKDRLCPRRRAGDTAPGRCRNCPNVSHQGGCAYERRRDAALLQLLTGGATLDTPEILAAAKKYAVCPHELSLDASEYCDLIVCDYGYLLDPAVQLKRYFQEPRGERYVFLLDEAHNLPDRARSTYSASLSRAALESFAETALTALPDDAPLRDAVDLVRAALDGVEALCAGNAEADEEDATHGFCLLSEVPPELCAAAARLGDVCGEYLRRDYASAAPLFEDMRHALRDFTRAAQWMDDDFSFYAESAGENLIARILCLDPARLLDGALSHAHAASLFSATLSPMEYYAHTCGCEDAVRLELPSPYEGDNLCLVTVDSLSTRHADRRRTAQDVAEMLSVVTESRGGNYIFYFSSYRYMTEVCTCYRKIAPGQHVIVQKPGMEIEERDRFLRAFETGANTGEGVAAFCVLGGLFSEGIDLSGEKLIGAVIVGIGLPGLSSELNILADYYERTRESGLNYAYLYPAINKILQAAGRVIRSEEDRGVVILIDDRYADPEIRHLFPPHWKRMQYTGDPWSLQTILERFWEET